MIIIMLFYQEHNDDWIRQSVNDNAFCQEHYLSLYLHLGSRRGWVFDSMMMMMMTMRMTMMIMIMAMLMTNWTMMIGMMMTIFVAEVAFWHGDLLRSQLSLMMMMMMMLKKMMMIMMTIFVTESTSWHGLLLGGPLELVYWKLQRSATWWD